MLHQIGRYFWISDGVIKTLKINPDKINIQSSYYGHKINSQTIYDDSIAALENQQGAFAKQTFCTGYKITKKCEGIYYTKKEWKLFGNKDEHGNVIEFKHKKVQFIIEPFLLNERLNTYPLWKFINDSRGHKLKLKPNVIFQIEMDENNKNFPVAAIYCTQKIQKGSQLYVGYGKKYWNMYLSTK